MKTISTPKPPSGRKPVPVSFGFHPYFGLPNLPRAQWRLELPAMRRLVEPGGEFRAKFRIRIEAVP